LELIIDYKNQDCKHQEHGNSWHLERSRLQNKKSRQKGKWPKLECIALSTKLFCITDVLAGFFTDNTDA
jgi:hypothetical protein